MNLLPNPQFFLDQLITVADPIALVFVIASFLLFYLAKLIKDFLNPTFNLEKELLTHDNPALALSSAGYWLGVGIIIAGLVSGNFTNLFPSANPLVSELAETLLWGIIGILLLNAAIYINDKLILSAFSNIKEIIHDRNVGIGAVHCGSYIAAAFIIRPFVATPSLGSFYIDILLTVLYFILAQLLLFIFFKLYAKIVGYDLLKELEADNSAAGVATALSLVAIANIIAYPLYSSYNLFLFVLYFINGTIVLIGSRFITDKVILSKSALRDEIVRDRNWGAATIEGTLALAISFILTAAFSLL
ncbi:hypothetical protein COTS27_01647 [Spirochaetota bacterium]|nr:hypothetical protein COTS27_01647 [Spirochaetota bacterium]